MRVLKFGLLVSCAFLQISCSSLVMETAQRSVDVGRLNIKPTNITAKGAAAGAVAGNVFNLLLSSITNSMNQASIKALAFYCETENPSDKKEYSNCIEWGRVHFQRAEEFNNILNGKCPKCWNKAFDYAKTINSNVKEGVYQAKFDYTYAMCMPWGIDSMNHKELYQKHIECKKKAKKEATKFVKDIKGKLEKYLAKK